MEKLNRLKGSEIEKSKQTAREVLSEEEIKSYNEFSGQLERIEKGQVVISYYIEEAIQEAAEFDLISSPSEIETYRQKRKISLSIEFRTKIIEETKNLLNWVKCYKGRSGKWIVVNGELFDVEWQQ